MKFAVGNESDLYDGMNTAVQQRILHFAYWNYLDTDCCNAISSFVHGNIENLMSNVFVYLTVRTCAVTVYSEPSFEPQCGRSKTKRSVHWNFVGRVAQSVQRLVTCSTVRGSNLGGGEILRTCPDQSWGPPSLLYNGYRVFGGGLERPGREADPSHPSSAVGYERVELYLYSACWPYGLYRASVPVQG